MELQQVEQAWEFYYESMINAKEVGKKGDFTYALRKLAEICLSRGQYRQAGEYLLQGLDLAPEMDPDILVFQCLFPLLNAAEGIAPPAKLARLLGYSDKHVEDILAQSEKGKARYDRIAAALQARLDPATFQASLEAGRQMSLEQVQAEARLVAEEVASYQPAQEAQ